MFLLNLLENASLAEWLASAAGQLLIISILGIVAVKLLSGKSAPVRSVTAAGGLVSMLLVFVMSAAFQVSSIAWYKADLSRLATPKTAVATAIRATAPMMETRTPELDIQPLPDISMANAVPAKSVPVIAIKEKQTKSFQLKAAHYINALGLIWAGGIIFMLLKLGYGLAFIRGFRFGLNRISDERITRLLKATAAVFNRQRLPELYTSPRVESPVTIGMTNPIVIIPEKLFATLSDNELRSILLHELAHIYHCDHVIGVFKRIIIAVNWWNPLAYIISARHAVAREEVADNYVLRELAPKVYSECLAGLAEKICLISSYPAAAGMAGNYSTLEHRVKDIMSKKRKLTMTTGTTFKLTAAAVCAMLALAVAGCRYGAADPTPPLTPEKIIAKMAETYAKCKSYQDTGTVKTIFIQDGGNRTDEKPFATAFARPDQFRFEYKEKVDSFLKEKPCYIVWRKGDEILTWFFARPDITKVKSLSSGIAGATGVSGGSAHTIPALLLPEVGGRKLSDIKEAKLLEDGIFDNVNCYRIQGKFISKSNNDKTVSKPTVIWIDKNAFLVRRIDEETVFTFSNFRTEVTTTYSPAVNSDIPGKALEFDPPGGSEALNRIKLAEEAPSLSLDSPMGNSVSDEKEARRLSMIGYGLSAKQAAELEQKLSKNPDDVNTITLLLNYWSSIYRGDNVARQKKEKYILWLIEHHPDTVILNMPDIRLDSKSKETAEAAKKLWIEQTGKNPKNAQVFWNAANSVSGSDKTLSEQFYIKGQSLDPENPRWAERLGNIYFWGNQPEKALNEYKKAYPKATDAMNKVLAISRMAKSAVDCGKIQEAGEYALEMQRLAATYGNKNEDYGRLMFNSNLVLGKIALKQGKIDEAGKYLLEAGKTPISLKNYSADFSLVKDLLAAGQKEIVLQFFQSCAQFWDKTKCDEWIKQINDDKIPSFKDEPKANSKVNEVKKGPVQTQAAPVQQITPSSVSGDKKSEAAKPEAGPEQQPKSAYAETLELTMKGGKLSAEAAAELEQKLSQNPEDMESLAILLGYYYFKRHTDKAVKEKRENYVLWLIKNHPEADILDNVCGQISDGNNYPEAKKLWLEQLKKHPDNLRIVKNAGKSFLGSDIDIAIECFEKAVKLDSKNSKMWYWQLGSAYDLKGLKIMLGKDKTPVKLQEAAATFENSLRAFENAYANSTAKEQEDSFILSPMAKAALKAGEFDKAEEYSKKMLAAAKRNNKTGSPVYNGNCILGMIAINKGDIDAAGKYLLEAGKSTGSPLLDTPGLDLSLAQELLSKGRRDIVLEFLKGCSKFWKYKGVCDQLIKEMENGGTPDLSPAGIMARIYPKPQDNAVNKDAAKPETEEVKKDDAKIQAGPAPETKPSSAPDSSKNAVSLSPQEKAQKRMLEDSKIYSKDELKSIEELFRVINAENLQTLLAKYKKANRSGCALLWMGQISKGNEQIKYLQQAIDEFSDCFDNTYGVQVGAYARYLLAGIYAKNGEKTKSAKLIEEIKKDFPDAVDYYGKSLVTTIMIDTQRDKAGNRMQEDSKIYSQDELKAIEDFYRIEDNKFNSENLKTLLAKYKKSNRAGCAALYLGQINRGDEQIKYLQQAIDDFSDCFYGDGAQVGAYARLLLARIYLKNGEKNKAAKLFEEIKTDYPGSIDHNGNSLASIISLTSSVGQDQTISNNVRKIRSIAGYWNRFEWWQTLDHLQKTTGAVNQKEQEDADALIQDLIRNVCLVKIKPINGFDPATPKEFLSNFNKHSSLQSKYSNVGGASFFRTTDVNNQLIGSFLTEEPEQMKKDIEKNPSLQFLSSEKVTPEMLIKHMASEQDSLMDRWKTRGPQILETIPANGAKDVDPGLTQITVKFDRKMGNSSWSVCTVYPGGNETQFPINGKLHYDDSSTVFIIPVKLQPDHTYKTSLNAKRFIGFVSADGTPLYPYPYTFTTKSVPGADAKTMENWKTTGPKILETIPANGAKDVDPDLTKITVKFDRKMRNNSWAVCNDGTDGKLPTAGSPYYDDTSTIFTVPLGKLQPNHTYRASMNAQGYTSFVSADGTPLYPYPLSFTTGSKPESVSGDKKSEAAKPEVITGQQAKPVVMDGTTLALKGDKLSVAEAAGLEQKLSQNPEDMKSLTILLGYYFQKKFTDKTIKEKREKYILWLIANHPEAEVLALSYGHLDSVMDNYPEAKKLWLEQLEKHPDDIKVVVNAAKSFTLGDPDLAIKYFEQAIKLDPKNSRMWYWQLGNVYNLKGMFGDKKTPVTPKEAAAAFDNALCAFENAYANSTAKEKEDSFMLKPIAEAALKAGKLDKAEEYANKMLGVAKNDKKDGNLVYYGNFVLGMVAVKNENIDAAGKYLLEAGKSTGSPQLNSFGPDMSLAQELLTKGKRDIVLEFLKECSKFWKFYGICDQLIKEIENGGTPDLSQNGMRQRESAFIIFGLRSDLP